jgi:hypothetical protein
MQISMYLDEMATLEDHMEEVVVLDVLEPTCVYTFICVEIKTNTETVASASCVPKGGDDAGERGPFFFLSWRT